VSVFGDPGEWADLLDSFVPDILSLIVAAWESLPAITENQKEDDITIALCREMRQLRSSRGLPFQIQVQQSEIDPPPGEQTGRLDVAINLLVPSEQIYFCLEGKRLNVVVDGTVRAYASEYVNEGMMRFISGRYSRAVSHGGMIGYVLDRNIARAIANVQENVYVRHLALRMVPPGELLESQSLEREPRARESHHRRDRGMPRLRLHHLFVAPR
jgi:hypothetical protein